jgi:hypothetical protein
MPAATSILAAMAGPDQPSVPAGADAIHLHHGWWPPGKIPAPDGCIAHALGALGRGHAPGRITRGSLRISRKHARHRRPHRHGRPRAGHPPPPMPLRPIPTAGMQPRAGPRRVVAHFAKKRPPPPTRTMADPEPAIRSRRRCHRGPSGPPGRSPWQALAGSLRVSQKHTHRLRPHRHGRPRAGHPPPPMPPRPIPTAGTRPRAGSLRVSRKNAHCLRPHHHGRP